MREVLPSHNHGEQQKNAGAIAQPEEQHEHRQKGYFRQGVEDIDNRSQQAVCPFVNSGGYAEGQAREQGGCQSGKKPQKAGRAVVRQFPGKQKPQKNRRHRVGRRHKVCAGQ